MSKRINSTEVEKNKRSIPIALPFWQLGEIYDYIHEVRGEKATKEQTKLKKYIMKAIADSVEAQYKKVKSS